MWRHFGGALRYPLLAVRYRLLVQNFFRRELVGRFRGSFLGVFWVLLHPIFLFSIYFFVFGYVFRAKLSAGIVETAGPSPDFAVYMLSGLLVINSFMEATSRSCTTIHENGNLVKKVAFPCELLPVHLVGVSTVVFLVGVTVLLALGIPTGTIVPDAQLAFWPLVLAVQVVLSLGVGLTLACVYVFMRDAAQVWSMFGQALLFLSPTFWRLAPDGLAAPEPWATVLRANPLYALMQAHRHSLGVTRFALDGTLLGHLAVAAAWAFAALLFGYGLFMSRREKFADMV